MLRQPCLDRVHPEIFDVFCILVCVSDPVLVVTLLPYFTMEDHLPPRTVGESALDELHCFLKRYERSRCKDQMNVISHEDELVNLQPLPCPIFTNDLQQQIAERIGLQYESSLPRCKGGEESGYHTGHGKPGLKPNDQSATLSATLKRRSPLLKQGAPTDNQPCSNPAAPDQVSDK
jgi:hypothetical protein